MGFSLLFSHFSNCKMEVNLQPGTLSPTSMSRTAFLPSLPQFPNCQHSVLTAEYKSPQIYFQLKITYIYYCTVSIDQESGCDFTGSSAQAEIKGLSGLYFLWKFGEESASKFIQADRLYFLVAVILKALLAIQWLLVGSHTHVMKAAYIHKGHLRCGILQHCTYITSPASKASSSVVLRLKSYKMEGNHRDDIPSSLPCKYLIMTVTSHHFCHILLFRRNSQALPTVKGRALHTTVSTCNVYQWVLRVSLPHWSPTAKSAIRL